MTTALVRLHASYLGEALPAASVSCMSVAQSLATGMSGVLTVLPAHTDAPLTVLALSAARGLSVNTPLAC